MKGTRSIVHKSAAFTNTSLRLSTPVDRRGSSQKRHAPPEPGALGYQVVSQPTPLSEPASVRIVSETSGGGRLTLGGSLTRHYLVSVDAPHVFDGDLVVRRGRERSCDDPFHPLTDDSYPSTIAGQLIWAGRVVADSVDNHSDALRNRIV